MSEIADMLSEFHAALGDEHGRGGADLRIDLHREEHAELIDALQELAYAKRYGWSGPGRDRHRLEVLARELADVVYLAFGTAHAFAIDLDAALAESHRAAMSKVDPVCVTCDSSGVDPEIGRCRSCMSKAVSA